jgi:hypothetical protein
MDTDDADAYHACKCKHRNLLCPNLATINAQEEKQTVTPTKHTKQLLSKGETINISQNIHKHGGTTYNEISIKYIIILP